MGNTSMSPGRKISFGSYSPYKDDSNLSNSTKHKIGNPPDGLYVKSLSLSNIDEATSKLKSTKLSNNLKHDDSQDEDHFMISNSQLNIQDMYDLANVEYTRLHNQTFTNDNLTNNNNDNNDKDSQNNKKVPIVFNWTGGGKEISISGTFNNWGAPIPLVKRKSGDFVIVECSPGVHEYKFLIDGNWYHDPTKPFAYTEAGLLNNIITVNSEDSDVLNALEHDLAHSKKSPTLKLHESSMDYGRTVPVDMLSRMKQSAQLDELNNNNSTTNTSVNENSSLYPPVIPPHLLQGILNMDLNLHCDPNLLPQPNHVIVNHLYALSIKDNVIVLNVITRFRQKHVTTLFYSTIPSD